MSKPRKTIRKDPRIWPSALNELRQEFHRLRDAAQGDIEDRDERVEELDYEIRELREKLSGLVDEYQSLKNSESIVLQPSDVLLEPKPLLNLAAYVKFGNSNAEDLRTPEVDHSNKCHDCGLATDPKEFGNVRVCPNQHWSHRCRKSCWRQEKDCTACLFKDDQFVPDQSGVMFD